MALEIRQNVGLLAACVCIRDLNLGSIESIFCASVLQAVHLAIDVLKDRDDKIAVVVVGEAESENNLEKDLVQRSSSLCTLIDQAGLFLTLAAQDIVRDRLMSDVRFEDFGIHGVDDLGRAERLFAVIHPDLVEPVLPQRRVPGNCPRLHKSFVGRHRERDELQALILDRQLVTIVGPPGVGKTTTAIHVARSFDDEYDDPVWWFSVDDRASLDELLQAIGNAKGMLTLSGALSIERVAEALSQKRGIIILDGCESMTSDIGALCTAILSQTKGLTLLLTSTRGIGIEDEHIYYLKPMSLPKPGDLGEDALIGSDALSLFFDRVTQAGIRLSLEDRNIQLATTICERVDGLPVAIELVAASLRTSSLQKLSNQLSEDLGQDFKRSVIDRDPKESLSRGLNKALELSYQTLNSGQHELLKRLAIFRSEWKTDVAFRFWEDQFQEEAILSLHQALADSSWLAYDPDRDTYRMLHTVRSFCWEKAGNDRPELLRRFCVGMSDLARKVCAELQSASAMGAEALLSRHYSDFVLAFEEALGSKEMAACSSDLMKSMVHFWLRRNLLEDAERLSAAHLVVHPSGIEAARALVMIGIVHLRRRNLDQATVALERCLDLTRIEANAAAEAIVLNNLALTMLDKGEYAKARAYYQEVIPMFRSGGHTTRLCQALCNAAWVEVSSTIYEEVPKEAKLAFLAEADRRLEEARLFSDKVDAVALQALWHIHGAVARAKGDVNEAEPYLLKAIAVCARHELRHEAGEATEALAEISLTRKLAATAAKLLGLSMQIRKESGKTRTEPEMARFGVLVSKLHEQIGTERAEKLMRYGEKLDLAEILTPTIFNV